MEDIVARVLMGPDIFMELAEMIEGILGGFEEARPVEKDENYKGVEFG